MPDERVAASGAPVTDQLLGGRYRLRERIGRGGMADVFAADDELLHRAVAVKVFRVDAGASSDQRRIDAEVHTLAALRHPGLVMIFDAGAAPEPHGQAAPFLVMELISGPALSQRLTSGPMTPEESALLGADLAATLAYVHAQGVVHRDVKPANVLLDIPAVAGLPFAAKLTDFGISRLVDSTRLTMHGMTIGTANYLSPEQVSSSDVGPPSDIYSLGLVLIECLTGELAYPGLGVEAALTRLHRPPPVPTGYGQEWTALLTAMTVSDPSARPTAAQVCDALRELGPAHATRPSLPTPSAPTELLTGIAGSTQLLTEPVRRLLGGRPGGPGRRRWGRAAAVALAVLVISVLIAVLAGSRSAPPPPTSSPAPSYQNVPGQLGNDLRKLGNSIG